MDQQADQRGKSAATAWTPIVVPGAARCMLGDYHISVWTPESAAPPHGFPAVYVLDGDELFLSFAETVRRLSRHAGRTGISPAVVVGVAAGSADDRGLRRYRDFTFGPPAAHADAPAGAQPSGGADFLGVLSDAVPYLVAQRAPVDPSRVALYAHSFGAYFALHAIARRPGAFAACGAISPSLWWDPVSVEADIGRITGTRIFLAAGEREARTADQRRIDRAMVPRLDAFEALLLAHLPHDAVGKHIFDGEDHGSVATVAIPRFLRFLNQPA